MGYFFLIEIRTLLVVSMKKTETIKSADAVADSQKKNNGARQSLWNARMAANQMRTGGPSNVLVGTVTGK